MFACYVLVFALQLFDEMFEWVFHLLFLISYGVDLNQCTFIQ